MDRKSIHSLEHFSNSGSKNHSLSPHLDAKHIKINSQGQMKDSLMQMSLNLGEDNNNKEIIAQSSILINSQHDSPYNEKNKQSLKVLPYIQSSQKYTIDHNQSYEMSLNSYHSKDQNQQHLLINHNKNLSIIQKDQSLKRLQRDKSTDRGIFINSKQVKTFKNGSEIGNIKISQQKLSDIYNLKQQKALSQIPEDKRIRNDQQNQKSQGVPSSQIFNPSQKANIPPPYIHKTIDTKDEDIHMHRIQIKDQMKSINNSVKSSLFHNGASINQRLKKSSNYAENLAKIANVYAKPSQSPIQSRKMKEQITNSLVGGQSLSNPNQSIDFSKISSIGNSMSTVKLPELHNRSIGQQRFIYW